MDHVCVSKFWIRLDEINLNAWAEPFLINKFKMAADFCWSMLNEQNMLGIIFDQK